VLPLAKRAFSVGGLPLEWSSGGLFAGTVQRTASAVSAARRTIPRNSSNRHGQKASRTTARRRHLLPVQIPPRILKQEANQHVQKPHRRILRRRIRYASLGQMIGRFDAEPSAVVLPSLVPAETLHSEPKLVARDALLMSWLGETGIRGGCPITGCFTISPIETAPARSLLSGWMLRKGGSTVGDLFTLLGNTRGSIDRSLRRAPHPTAPQRYRHWQVTW
jgi:hypothetical protein